MTEPMPQSRTRVSERWSWILLAGYVLFVLGVVIDNRWVAAFWFGVAGIAILIIIRGTLLWLGERQKGTK